MDEKHHVVDPDTGQLLALEPKNLIRFWEIIEGLTEQLDQALREREALSIRLAGNAVIRPPFEWVDYSDLRGQAHIRRGLEVAMAGHHSVLIVGTERGMAEEFAAWAWQYDVNDIGVIAPCPCGNFRDRRKKCLCGHATLVAWWDQFPVTDIVLEAPALPSNPMPGESEATIFARVDGKSGYTSRILDEDGLRLLAAVVRQCNLSQKRANAMVGVARTIANLDHCPEIGIVHIAEASAYVKEWVPW